jgi:soluble lytic murein transglycosylase-like protein
MPAVERTREEPMRVRFLLAMALPLGAVIAATPASAQDALCTSGAIGARFAEARKLCGTPVAAPQPASSAPVVPVRPPVATPVFAGAPVSVSMPGYRKRLAAAVQQVRVRAPNGVPTDALITAIGRRYRIDPHLLASMMSAESGGRMTAVSNKGALGLMQVMPGTARSLGVRDPRMLLNDRVLAISTGAAYLKKLQAQFGNNVPLVVAAYNAGPGAVVRYNGIPRYRETQGYVTRVMSGYVSRRSGAVR